MSVTYDEEWLENDLCRINLSGTLDAPGTMAIEEAFQALLHKRGTQFVIDLSGVDYMSSYGLRMLLMGAKALRGIEGGLHLAAPNQRVMEVIKVAGYDTMFPVFETVEEAIAFLTG
jgi:anti-sigma B factor antagonist